MTSGFKFIRTRKLENNQFLLIQIFSCFYKNVYENSFFIVSIHIYFAGYAYSLKPNPWHWLTSKEAAEKMAEKVKYLY